MKEILSKIFGFVLKFLTDGDKLEKVTKVAEKVSQVKDVADKVKNITHQKERLAEETVDIVDTHVDKVSGITEKVEEKVEGVLNKDLEVFDKAKSALSAIGEKTKEVKSKMDEKNLKQAAQKANEITLDYGTARFNILLDDGDDEEDLGLLVSHSAVQTEGKVFIRIGLIQQTTKTKHRYREESNLLLTSKHDPLVVSVLSWLEQKGLKPKAIYNVYLPNYKHLKRESFN